MVCLRFGNVTHLVVSIHLGLTDRSGTQTISRRSCWATYDNQGVSLQHSAAMLVTLMRGCTAIYSSHWPGTGQRILHSLAVRLIMGLIIFCQMSIIANPLSDVARPLLPFSRSITHEPTSGMQVLCWIASCMRLVGHINRLLIRESMPWSISYRLLTSLNNNHNNNTLVSSIL